MKSNQGVPFGIRLHITYLSGVKMSFVYQAGFLHPKYIGLLFIIPYGLWINEILPMVSRVARNIFDDMIFMNLI